MATKRKPQKRTIQTVGEFAFDPDTSNGGKLTYRCMEFVITCENDEWTESELEFWQQVVDTLNQNYVGID
jgi:hypothetical protein